MQWHGTAPGVIVGASSAGGLGLALYGLGLVLREQGEFARAATLFEECVALHRALGDREGMAQALLGLGDVARDQGDVAQMRHIRRAKPGWSSANWACNGRSALRSTTWRWQPISRATCTHALSLVEESVALFRSMQADASLAEVLITLGQIVRAQGDRGGGATQR